MQRLREGGYFLTIIAIDDNLQRLTELTDCLRKAFPKDNIAAFTDVTEAIRYAVRREVDVVFADSRVFAMGDGKIWGIIMYFCEGAQIYLVSDEKMWRNSRIKATDDVTDFITRPVTADIIREITENFIVN
ncbi:hypothetical protein FACS189490_09110 [Clostridia bacterium]|nr:hypothetical protein FACS189490_09110 [Clostridia bacterium]